LAETSCIKIPARLPWLMALDYGALASSLNPGAALLQNLLRTALADEVPICYLRL
jgi:hypothetical protein